MTRVYVPLTIEALLAADAAGEVTVPDDLVAATDETEEEEYAASMTAADASAALGDPGRRVVLVAELDRVPDPGETLPRKRWVAVLADETDRGPDADPDDDLGWFGLQEIPHLA